MNENVLFFFAGHEDALPLYEKLEQAVQHEIPDVQIKVQKSQISFYNRRMFACVSFAKVRKKEERPTAYIVVTFGLGWKVDSPRIDVATEPYPGRWTHHVLIQTAEEIDSELMAWVREAAGFSAGKR